MLVVSDLGLNIVRQAEVKKEGGEVVCRGPIKCVVPVD